MVHGERRILETRPLLVQRAGGGWLAVSEPGSALRIGVAAQTEESARESFANALRQWARLSELEHPPAGINS